MDKLKPTAFISYSWDSEQHQLWVLELMNQLRRNGVVATMDIIETQSGTVNLNIMMVKALRDYDYVILVLTEEYAKKADELNGGVGFETELSLPVLINNPNKIILITRDSFSKAMPFHLQGYHGLDFTKDANFEGSFKQLLHRVHNIPLYEVAPVGDIPDLKPIGISEQIVLPNKSRVVESEQDEERIVWLLPRGFLVIEDVEYQDDPWNVKAEFWNYDGQPLYGVHYKPEYKESWRDYERRFRTLQIPEADWHLDEYYLALLFIQQLRGRKEQDNLEDLVQEKCSFGHHVFYYAAGTSIYLPEVPHDFKVLFDTGELRDLLYELRSLQKRSNVNSEPILSATDALRHELLVSAHEYFGSNHISYKAILDIANDFDSKDNQKKMVMWLDRAATVLETALNRVLRKTAPR